MLKKANTSQIKDTSLMSPRKKLASSMKVSVTGKNAIPASRSSKTFPGAK